MLKSNIFKFLFNYYFNGKNVSIYPTIFTRCCYLEICFNILTDSGNFVKTFSPSKSTNAKVVFRCHTNQNPSNQTEGKKTGRSPLKVIDSSSPRSQVKYDTNSPRAIVQRKQASKLGMLQNPARRKFNLGSPTKYNQLKEHDKEN